MGRQYNKVSEGHIQYLRPVELEMDLSNYQALEIRVWHKRMRSGICREMWESAEYTWRIKLREADITKCVLKCR